MASQREPGPIPAVKTQNRADAALQKPSIQTHLGVSIFLLGGGANARLRGMLEGSIDRTPWLPWWDVPILIALGLLAGGLAGLLGIGGGLIFAPLLLWLDLPPPSGPGHQQFRHCAPRLWRAPSPICARAGCRPGRDSPSAWRPLARHCCSVGLAGLAAGLDSAGDADADVHRAGVLRSRTARGGYQ